MSVKSIRIGGASGYWGDASFATPQLIANGDVDYLVYDYLAEVTMSILARARSVDANLGYAVDFVSVVMKRNLKQIARQNIKVISNAGGVNPEACGVALRVLIADSGLDLKVAVISGDDLIEQSSKLASQGIKEMFSGEDFPSPEKIASINAYLGAVPIAKALKSGADIVITGRCVDSAVTLGACLAAFDWPTNDFDKLSQASLAGHIIECGPQATGGNFTDWRLVKDSLVNIGYPIVEVLANADFTVCKPAGTGGLVSEATVAEQMVYEIGDPQAYKLPDVICDFSEVTLEQVSEDHVLVRGAKGAPAPQNYKVCATYIDGYRAGMLISFTGFDAEEKAQLYASSGLERAERLLKVLRLDPYSETSVEVIGSGSQYGKKFDNQDAPRSAQEVVLKVGVRHNSKMGAVILIKEMTGLALATPPGLSIFNAGRPKPSPVIRLFSFLMPKDGFLIGIDVDGVENISFQDEIFAAVGIDAQSRPQEPICPKVDEELVVVPLIDLAWGRSGDKGDKANIGIIARKPEYLPWIWAGLSEGDVQAHFSHFNPSRVERFLLLGTSAINYLLHDVLGGGGMASLRNDPQGKAYAQILLAHSIQVPKSIVQGVATQRMINREF